MKKAEKSFYVENLTAELKSAKSTVLVNFAGMSVKKQQELKNKLREAGARMVVVKNTLLKIAGKNASIPQEVTEDNVLTGQTAVILAEKDPISPIQIIGKYAKENEMPELKIGIVEGEVQDKISLLRISTLPSKEVLFAQVVGAVSAPLHALTGTLSGNMQKLVYILDQKRQQS